MNYYITPDGNYYDGGDHVAEGSIEVPQRPSPSHIWNGSAWIPGPPVVPAMVTMRQAREALIRRGLFAAVDNHIAGLLGIEGDLARNEWNNSQTVERNRPLTISMAELLGIVIPEELDELFIYAATL